ncbi:winged helix-turn-helix domain-containing protein [Pyrobaculum sp. 3827-6]|uniref:winged helix-turn-helix domain-containing protein n=1 Tax=Pyrobaculum sp. 3827-6 TaxID=2983604 RepID=UPI0021D95E48|nr:winged helix-turn-helix domain-containing protein [Pyrobaculum sp. 3827-6]MCU7788247.1 winged helix-turn-helix domain-containing protein [Pyrobaculum sp. 3827-6]
MEYLTYEERSILTMLVTESWASPSSIAKRLGVSRQLAWYTLRRLREAGVVGDPMLYVRPDHAGLHYAFFQSEREPEDYTVLKFETLEGTYIFAVPFRTEEELRSLRERYGRPWFVPSLKPKPLTELQRRTLRLLLKNPLISSAELARELDLPRTKARKLVSWARRNVNFTYWVDLRRAGIAALAVKTEAPLGAYAAHKFFKCFAYATGFYAVAFPDLGRAAEFVRKLKAEDPKARINVVVGYELRPPEL